jgi:hypothetical protein
MTIKDGGPAFSTPAGYYATGIQLTGGQSGMSLRDWFAGTLTITQGELAETVAYMFPKLVSSPPSLALLYDAEAELRYSKADAMLARREKAVRE